MSNYRYKVLAILWLVAFFRIVDLQVFAILLESIKNDLVLSDTQLALLGGLAFAIFYSTFGIPIAWLADRVSRKNIIATSLGVWSGMTALCGLASNFSSLFLFRMGVGIGEAGGYPPTTSLLADYFTIDKRGKIYAILGSAIPVGVFFGFILGGVINDLYGWRFTFNLVGIPGVLLAIIVFFFIKDIPRGSSELNNKVWSAPSFKQSFQHLWTQKAYRFALLGFSMFLLGSYGFGIWMPSFYIRHYDFTSSEIGIWLAVIYGGGGTLGTLGGGWIAEHLSLRNNNMAWLMRISAIGMVLSIPFGVISFLYPHAEIALMFHFCMVFFMHFHVGPTLATVQLCAGSRHRSLAQAVNVLFSNLIGLPLGPLFIGLISDAYTPEYGSITLAYAFTILLLITFSLSGIFFFYAGKKMNHIDWTNN